VVRIGMGYSLSPSTRPCAARARARAGDLKQADIVLDQLVETFRDKHVPDPVLATIAEQAETARTELHAATELSA
jgi:hypothetical protein